MRRPNMLLTTHNELLTTIRTGMSAAAAAAAQKAAKQYPGYRCMKHVASFIMQPYGEYHLSKGIMPSVETSYFQMVLHNLYLKVYNTSVPDKTHRGSVGAQHLVEMECRHTCACGLQSGQVHGQYFIGGLNYVCSTRCPNAFQHNQAAAYTLRNTLNNMKFHS